MKTPKDTLIEAEDRFETLMNQQDTPFKRRVEERFNRLETWTGVDTGECVTWFNEILPGGSFTGPAALDTLAIPPAVAKETAAILCQVSMRIWYVRDQEDLGLQYLAWKNLNRDAKGWCKALLLAQAPSSATSDELRDLLTAKSFVAILVDDLLPCTSRSPGDGGKPNTLGGPIDE